MIRPLELIYIAEKFNVSENQIFTHKVNGVRYYFKIVSWRLYISSDQITWQETFNVFQL